MSYIVWHEEWGPVARVDGDAKAARLREGEIAIPCEQDADPNDHQRWAAEAEAQKNRVPTLEEVKEAKRAELMVARDATIAAGFLWGGRRFPISTSLQTDMLTQLMAMQMLPPPPAFVYQWKDADGIYRDVGTAAVFQAFCATAMSYGESLYAREQMLQEQVNAAQSQEEVAAVTWETVLS